MTHYLKCSKVLEIDSGNIKALYRRAQAYLGSLDFLEAELDVQKALVLQPDHAEMQALGKKIRVAQRDQAKKDSSLYSKMFSKPGICSSDVTSGGSRRGRGRRGLKGY